MFNEAELIDAINELSEGRHSIQNCERLAAVYTVLDHLQPGYSYKGGGIDNYGNSEFLQIISGKDERRVFALLDELMEAIQVLNPKLYKSFIGKLEGII